MAIGFIQVPSPLVPTSIVVADVGVINCMRDELGNAGSPCGALVEGYLLVGCNPPIPPHLFLLVVAFPVPFGAYAITFTAYVPGIASLESHTFQ